MGAGPSGPIGPIGATVGGSMDGKLRFGLAILTVFGVLSALSTDDGPVLCPLRRCSGGYCPACGLTRSGGRLLRGDLAGSWTQHPYLLIAVGQVGAVSAVWSSGSQTARRWLGVLMKPMLLANVGIMATVWIVRMADGSIPVPFLN